MSEPVWLDDELNLSSTAFAEEGYQDHPDDYSSTITKQVTSSNNHLDPTEEVTDFDDMHFNEGLDAIVRVDGQRRRAGMNRLYGVLFAVVVLVAITTVSIMVPKSRNDDDAHSINAYEERVNEIRTAFLEQGILNEIDPVEPGSPRYEAMKNVAIYSESLPSSASLSEEITSYPFIARYVIALALFTLKGPWFTFDDSSVCELFHKDGEPMSGVRCDEKGLPTSLNLGTCSLMPDELICNYKTIFTFFRFAENHGLSGQIPDEFGLLTTVQHLSLANNSLTGTFPSELCKLNELVTLNLGWNAIGGTVPECMGWMGSLQLLNVNYNLMTGSLKGAFKNVRQMYLSANNFSQAVPELVVNMANLVAFSARENKLYGNVDAAFDRHAERLVMLDVSANKRLGGPFPRTLLQNAPHLEVLSLGDNAITGKC